MSLSVKDSLPFDLRSYVVYKFVWVAVKLITKRHLSTKIKEHLETEKKLHV